MTLKELYRLVLDKLTLPEGNRQHENVIKTAINIGYNDLCTKIPVVEVITFTAPFTKIIDLPIDCLKTLELSHDNLGSIRDTDYNDVNGKIVLSTDLMNNMNGYTDSVLTVLYAQKQPKLVNDADVPNVSEQYHKALYYYALYIYANDDKYLVQYENVVGNGSYMKVDNTDYEETIRDIYVNNYVEE